MFILGGERLSHRILSRSDWKLIKTLLVMNSNSRETILLLKEKNM
jgi:hypothetical protein